MRYNLEGDDIMLAAINILIQLTVNQAAEWLAELLAGALDRSYTFPHDLISSVGLPYMASSCQTSIG